MKELNYIDLFFRAGGLSEGLISYLNNQRF